MKSMLYFAGLVFLLSLNAQQARAGCTGLCIHKDSVGTGNDLADTISFTPSATVYASYNGACAMLMAADNVTLVWFRNGVAVDTTDMSDAVFDGVWTYTTPLALTSPGTYTVYFKNFIGPSYECGRIVVLPQSNNSALSINIAGTVPGDFAVFPNPAHSQVTISGDEGLNGIEVRDSFGKLVLETTTSEQQTAISTVNWQKGLYFVRRKGSTQCRKLVIQ